MQVKRTVQIAFSAITFIGIVIGAVGSAATPTASALSLGSASLDVPLGSLGQPVANLLNPATQSLPVPVSLRSTPSNLRANVTTPVVDAPVTVDTALSPIVQPVTDTLRPVTDPILAPTESTPDQPATSTPSSSGVLTVRRSQTPEDLPVSGLHTSPQTSEPKTFFGSVASFFTSTLPEVLGKVTTTLIGKQVNPLPVAISAVVFLLTMLTVGAIVYTTNYGGVLTIGNLNLTKIARAHDLTQMAALVVTAVSLGVVAIFLSLTIL